MVGIGNDLHRLEANYPLVIGGISIESNLGCVAHSDGDVLIHSLIDAILGAAGLGDIGEWFPDTDPKYKGVKSSDLLYLVLKEIEKKNYKISNIDAIIMLQKPKLSKYKELIRKNIAKLCEIPIEKVNIKAKSGENIGIVGTSQGIESLCIVELI